MPHIIIVNKLMYSSILSMYLPNPSTIGRMQHEVTFYAELSWFEFIVFFLQD